jgi:hypothetical protein
MKFRLRLPTPGQTNIVYQTKIHRNEHDQAGELNWYLVFQKFMKNSAFSVKSYVNRYLQAEVGEETF